jgi:hypothetical protein
LGAVASVSALGFALRPRFLGAATDIKPAACLM